MNDEKQIDLDWLIILIDKIKNNEIELINIKNKYHKDLTYTINIKVKIKQ